MPATRGILPRQPRSRTPGRSTTTKSPTTTASQHQCGAWLRANGTVVGDGRRQTRTRRTLSGGVQGFTNVSIFSEPNGARSNYWLNTLVIDREYAPERDKLLSALHAHGIHARPCGRRCTCSDVRNCPRSRLPVAEDMNMRCVNLPSSSFLAASEQTSVNRI